MLAATSKSSLSALLAGSPPAAAAAELFVSAEWSTVALPAGLLLMATASLGTMGYLVTREVAKRLTATPSSSQIR